MTTVVSRITKEELKKRLSDPDVIIIDVRANWKDSTYKIRNARPENPDGVHTWGEKYAKDKTLILYCAFPAEKDSSEVARMLIEKGYRHVQVLAGGWKIWQDAQYPIERIDAGPLPDRVVTGILSDKR